MNKNSFTYKKSGVDIKAADKFVKFISSITSKKRGKKKFNNIGGFGSISNIPKNMKNPKIVACTDGVGTKIEIANMIKKYDTIGIDLVAMSVNDLIVQGAKPTLFLDYISINRIDLKKLKSILKGIVKGCRIAKCELVGGETAEMPDTYEKGKFDIAGFAVGIVDQKKILNKTKDKLKYYKMCINLLKKLQKINPVENIKCRSGKKFKLPKYNFKNLHKFFAKVPLPEPAVPSIAITGLSFLKELNFCSYFCKYIFKIWE